VKAAYYRAATAGSGTQTFIGETSMPVHLVARASRRAASAVVPTYDMEESRLIAAHRSIRLPTKTHDRHHAKH
jgi:hypothetical protein